MEDLPPGLPHEEDPPEEVMLALVADWLVYNCYEDTATVGPLSRSPLIWYPPLLMGAACGVWGV